jgi:hypothetical protein
VKFIVLLVMLLFSSCQEFYPNADRASATSQALKRGKGGFEGTTLPLDYDKFASDLEKQRR